MPGRWRWVRPSLNWLLVFVPISLVAELAHQSLLIFITSGLAIVPLAGLIGRATDQLAIRVGPRLGGLLNATFGNVTELIVAVLLVQAGNFVVVKASLVGSIIGNLLLVLGVSFVAGGFTRKEQHFNAKAAGVHSASLLLAVTGLGLPALLAGSNSHLASDHKEVVSIGVAATLMLLFVGLILIPIIGNAAEHSSAVFFAIRNKLDVTLEIAVGSSTQVALFVAPAVVFISLALGRPMDFIFTGFEIGAVAIATVVLAVISLDGRSNWLEGLQLISVFLIIALAAFFL